ncbi:hypothetical protein BFP72_07190 [Reichenbachiella sp. 5M10]|uniref:acyl-[acyl-carrier-protein] thioesterase n=1 Tax=Reichenbachiella sp. 5M10 TaxID=1889772 RepID=UPI000C14CBCF|nr:acyl-ACP thioesterase domain-containing protein [Reichenbachiella sp. 5M10]PIB35194.1 hypothetical protein BFP72_07190 [Reichenbachiella sp. 5M10]
MKPVPFCPVDSDYHWTVQVSSKDCSNRRAIKLPILLDYMQEAAWYNATQLGFSTIDLMSHGVTWVMNRMVLNIHRLPGHNETIDIETWPASMNKFYTKRDFRLTEGEEVLVEASSNWLVMDVDARKLIPIPSFIVDADFVVDRDNLPEPSGKLLFDTERVQKVREIQVSWFDLDINDHVNNTKIYQWLLDALDDDYLDQHNIQSMDVLFKHEIKLGDRLRSESYWDEQQDMWCHALIHCETRVLHAVAVSGFD